MNRKVLIAGLVITVPLVVLFAASFGNDPHVIRSPLVGREAPPFSLRPLDGTAPMVLGDLRGKPAVVNFWATWCQPCKAEHGVLRDAAARFGDRVQFLGIVYEDEPVKIREFLQLHGSGYPTLVDEAGKTAIAYGVYGVPETFFLDATGKVVDKHAGPLTPGTLVQYLRPLMGTP